MTRFLDFIRKNSARRSAIADLRGLSAEQRDDIGISPDRIGDVVDSMLSRPAPFDLNRRIKPEFDLRSFGQHAPALGRPF